MGSAVIIHGLSQEITHYYFSGFSHEVSVKLFYLFIGRWIIGLSRIIDFQHVPASRIFRLYLTKSGINVFYHLYLGRAHYYWTSRENHSFFKDHLLCLEVARPDTWNCDIFWHLEFLKCILLWTKDISIDNMEAFVIEIKILCTLTPQMGSSKRQF